MKPSSQLEPKRSPTPQPELQSIDLGAVRKSTLCARVANVFRCSLTMAWAFLVGFAGSVLALLPFLGDLFEAPDVKETVQSFLHPDYVPYYIIAISVITALARLRTLNKSA